MRKRWTAAGLMIAMGGAHGLQAQGEMLVLTRGSDTIAVERLWRTASRLEGELVDRLLKVRWSFAVIFGEAYAVQKMENAIRRADADPAGPALQEATLVFHADSVFVEIREGATSRSQRLATRTGAVPYLNPSFALLELIVGRLRSTGSDSISVPLFMVSGGQTITARARRLGADSVAIQVGAEARLAMAPDGRFLGGGVPSQGLTLTRTAARDAALHVPRPDYSAPGDAPYLAEEVVIPTGLGHSLAGTLTLPKSRTGRVPALVTITGSGLQDRDEEIPIVRGGYRLFRQIADTLGRAGIAVLRMDDRGFGGSGGDAPTMTSEDIARDIEAGVAFLRARCEIDPARIGLIGHSEGGLVGPMVAARDTAIRVLVILAGPSRTGREILAYQNRSAVDRSEAIPAGSKDSAYAAALRTVDSVAAANPWVRFFLAYDPQPTAARVRAATLILHGATDRQVPAEQAEELAEAIRRGGNREVTVRVFPEANHLFLQDPDGDPRGYPALPSGTVRGDVIQVLVDWLVRRLR